MKTMKIVLKCTFAVAIMVFASACQLNSKITIEQASSAQVDSAPVDSAPACDSQSGYAPCP